MRLIVYPGRYCKIAPRSVQIDLHRMARVARERSIWDESLVHVIQVRIYFLSLHRRTEEHHSNDAEEHCDANRASIDVHFPPFEIASIVDGRVDEVNSPSRVAHS